MNDNIRQTRKENENRCGRNGRRRMKAQDNEE